MNSLFLDFVEEPEKVRDFYPLQGGSSHRAMPHRAELCEILKRQNEAFGNPNTAHLIGKLRDPSAGTVITGQQIGLLGGPMYTIWKALTVLRIREVMEKEKAVPCVPVFWMATEDHNWHEIMSFGLLKNDFELLSFSLKEHLFLSRQPTGTIATSHPEVRKVLLRAFAEIRIPQIKENYSKGTVAEAFARTLLWQFRDFPILLIDPNDAPLKRLAAPFFAAVMERMNELLDDLTRQNEILQSRNYPVQVKMEKDSVPLFFLEGNERRHLNRSALSATIAPENLSPSALLRPLLQDFLFPTLAYIAGPAEIAYFAQLHPWYKTMGIEQPKIFARASVTLLPEITRKFLQAKNFKPEEMFHKEDNLLDSLLSRSDLEQMKLELHEATKSVQAHLTQIKEKAETLDKTLRKSMETVERKINYQLQKAERKTFSALKRKNDVLYRQLVKARNVIFPGEKLQERYLNIFSFSSRLPDLIQELYQKMDPEAKGHQWIEI